MVSRGNHEPVKLMRVHPSDPRRLLPILLIIYGVADNKGSTLLNSHAFSLVMTTLNRSGAGVKKEGETQRLSLTLRDALHARPACEGPVRNYAFGARKKKIEC